MGNHFVITLSFESFAEDEEEEVSQVEELTERLRAEVMRTYMFWYNCLPYIQESIRIAPDYPREDGNEA